jgi:hypothetical protein
MSRYSVTIPSRNSGGNDMDFCAWTKDIAVAFQSRILTVRYDLDNV